MDKIERLSEKINFDNLVYYFEGKKAQKCLARFKCPLMLYNIIKNG